MEQNIEQQIFEQFSKANKILIALPEAVTADALASSLALALFLKRLDKDVEVLTSGVLPENLSFLPGYQLIKSDISSGKSLVVTVDTSVKKLDEISYQVHDGKVSIYLKPKDGSFTPEDVSFSTEKFPVDLLVAVECRSLESLGQLFEKHADLLFGIPKINIDNKAGNEYFGAINLIDINASSVAEIISSLFEKYETQLVNEDIATCLLTGIITKTDSFQHVQTTPKAFVKASELISLGGRQQEVIKNIYKTKSLPMLKLWGRALARLKVNDNLQAAYSALNLGDFEKAGASEKDLPEVLKELLDNISGYRLVALFSERPDGGVSGILAVHPQIDMDVLVQQIHGLDLSKDGNLGAFKVCRLVLPKTSLLEAETKLVDALSKTHSGFLPEI